MADRYQDRLFSTDAAPKAESDPLAELARLIGQTDPFGTANKPPPRPLQSRANARPQQYDPQAEDEDAPPAGPPPWMQRARQETVAPPPVQHTEYEEPEQDYQPKPVHPLHRYAAQQAPPPAPAPVAAYRPVEPPRQPEAFDDEPHYQSGDQGHDPSRYDDALYGQLEAGEQDLQRDPSYPDDPYAYEADEEEPEPRRRSSGLMTVAAVLALGVFGVGGAYAYRTYVGSHRSGEPPIIKADNTPTKVIPAQADAPAKTPDRMATGDGTEKIVSREETPVDVNSKTAGPRVVFPALNANANPPPVASVQTAQPAPAPITANGTLPNNEPRRVRTLAVKGDSPDGAQAAAAAPAAKPAAAAKPPVSRGNPSAANASVNAPMSLVPGQAEAAPAAPPTRVASTTTASVGSGGYLVQVSSQKNEADAQSSYRTLQGKYRSVLGSQPLVVKRVDLGEKGVYYRAFAGPFASSEEANQLCRSLMSAGGPQCLIQRN